LAESLFDGDVEADGVREGVGLRFGHVGLEGVAAVQERGLTDPVRLLERRLVQLDGDFPPLDEAHHWAAIRYIERNPVRAGLTQEAAEWPWSSARAHVAGEPDPFLSATRPYPAPVPDRREWLAAPEEEEVTERIRLCTKTGRPCGDRAFVGMLERTLGRVLRPLSPKCEKHGPKAGIPREEERQTDLLAEGDEEIQHPVPEMSNVPVWLLTWVQCAAAITLPSCVHGYQIGGRFSPAGGAPSRTPAGGSGVGSSGT